MADRYLVTGGAGFIGSHIVDALVRRGERVRVLDNFSSGRRSNLASVAADVEVVDGDLRDAETCAQAAQGARGIFHLGALGSVPRSVRDPATSHAANVDGTLNILLAARDCGVQRLVFASSSSIYGNSPVLPKREDQAPQPISPYALNKLVGEQYCRLFSQCYDLETVALRYFNVFGPRQDPASEYAAVIPRFIEAALTGRRPTVYGDGEQSRDFTYVQNIVEANLAAFDAPGASGGVYNVACGSRTSLNELLAAIFGIVGGSPDADYQPERAGDVRHSSADISAAKAAFDYSPTIGIDEGLRRTVDALRPALIAA
jgi:nucleoside-diphosphate-sugar epimerase